MAKHKTKSSKPRKKPSREKAPTPRDIGALATTETGDDASFSGTAAWETFPELVRIILEAVERFKIDAKTGRYPVKQTLVDHFKGVRLSTGSPISDHMAKFLATCCRPVDAMKGGNPKS